MASWPPCRRGSRRGPAWARSFRTQADSERYVWSCRGRGKSGGVRVIYCHFDEQDQIALLLIYDKTETDDLTPDQKKQLRRVIERW